MVTPVATCRKITNCFSTSWPKLLCCLSCHKSHEGVFLHFCVHGSRLLFTHGVLFPVGAGAGRMADKLSHFVLTIAPPNLMLQRSSHCPC